MFRSSRWASMRTRRSPAPATTFSRNPARRGGDAWTRREAAHARNGPVTGSIVGRVRGGFTVDLGGASAFLPGSQGDVGPFHKNPAPMRAEQSFAILKMDRPGGAIVVSRRAILEQSA